MYSHNAWPVLGHILLAYNPRLGVERNWQPLHGLANNAVTDGHVCCVGAVALLPVTVVVVVVGGQESSSTPTGILRGYSRAR